MPMEIDHIIPEALGGLTEEDNLWLACPLCNEHKKEIASPLSIPRQVIGFRSSTLGISYGASISSGVRAASESSASLQQGGRQYSH